MHRFNTRIIMHFAETSNHIPLSEPLSNSGFLPKFSMSQQIIDWSLPKFKWGLVKALFLSLVCYKTMENQIETHLDISRVLAKPRHFWQKILVLFWPVYLCQKHWSSCVDDVCLIFLTNSYVVNPGSYDSTHMCGNDGNHPPKKV